MKIISMNRSNYNEIKSLIKHLKAKGVFDDFNSSNIMLFDNGNISYAIAFTSKGEDTNYGITLFFGRNGLYSLIDMLTLSKEEMNEADYNLFVLSFKEKDELTNQEIDYYFKKDIKIKKKDNLTLTSFKSGYAPYISTNSEAKDIIKALYLCDRILEDSYLEIKDQFKDPNIQSMLVNINMHKHAYSLHFGGFPQFEGNDNKRIATLEEIKYFDGIQLQDYTLNIRAKNATIPVKIKECNKAVDPLLIVIGWPFNKFKFEYLISNRDEQREQIIVILREFFKENNMPTRIIFDNRFLYDALRDIFTHIGVDVSLDRNMKSDGFFDDITNTLHKIYEVAFIDQNLNTVSEEDMRLSLNVISKVLDTINTGEPNIECSDREKNIVVAFVDTITSSFSKNPNKDLFEGFDEEDEEDIKRYTETEDLNNKLVS